MQKRVPELLAPGYERFELLYERRSSDDEQEDLSLREPIAVIDLERMVERDLVTGREKVVGTSNIGDDHLIEYYISDEVTQRYHEVLFGDRTTLQAYLQDTHPGYHL